MRTIVSFGRLILAVLAFHATLSRAELWGYVDDGGVTHFATQRIDERYQLFFKGPTSLDAADAHVSNAQAALEQSALYRRVADHPNLRRFAALIELNAKAQALDPALIKAVIAVESAFEPDAVSAKGALGLMQIIPATAARYGLAERRNRTVAQQLLDPPTNVRIGARYLRDLLDLFGDDLALALAAYNAGEESVRRNGNRVPPFPETREYVALVRQFQALYRPPASASPSVPRPHIELRAARDSRPPNLRAP
jgi:soluble lytic murein transglycosylase-like protein